MTNINFINKTYTEDGLELPMIHFSSSKKDICVVCIHGMHGNIIENYFARVWGEILSSNQIGFLYEHNRGYSMENTIKSKNETNKRYGCRYEIFEESVYDIDLAIKEAYQLGYKRIILLGHSFGCNKLIYYYYKKKPNILGMIFASAPDMIGSHLKKEKYHEELLKEAKFNLKKNEPLKLLSRMVEDYMYFSSQTYYNWYREDTELDNLPVLKNPKVWTQFSVIDVPILTFSGLSEEDYYLHLELLKDKAVHCPNFTYEYILDSNHCYQDSESLTGEVILNWVKRFENVKNNV